MTAGGRLRNSPSRIFFSTNTVMRARARLTTYSMIASRISGWKAASLAGQLALPTAQTGRRDELLLAPAGIPGRKPVDAGIEVEVFLDR